MNIIGKRLRNRQLQSLVGSSMRSLLSTSDNFMNGTSIGYIEQMYNAWKEDPKKVHVSWNAYFTNLSQGITPAFVQPPTLGVTLPQGLLVTPAAQVGVSTKDIEDHLKILQLVSAYQLKGHEIADLDPLSKEDSNSFHRAQR